MVEDAVVVEDFEEPQPEEQQPAEEPAACAPNEETSSCADAAEDNPVEEVVDVEVVEELNLDSAGDGDSADVARSVGCAAEDVQFELVDNAEHGALKMLHDAPAEGVSTSMCCISMRALST